MKKSTKWLKDLAAPKKVFLGIGALIILGAASTSANHNQTTLNVTPASKKSASSQTKPQITTKTTTETQSIPFASTTVNDATMAKGTSKITTAGVAGSQILTYKITYTNGKQTDKELVSKNITLQPVTQITAIGTYVAPPAPSCPNGTYVNSAGNTVCSPYVSSSAPAGATAKCVDGTYSFSQSRQGTCSHHGGVGQWL